MFCRYVLDLVVIYWCIIQFLNVKLYSYLKRIKHFLIPISVSKADYRRKVEIVIFIATKTLWLWLSHLTRSLVEKALKISCKWLLFYSLTFKGSFQQADLVRFRPVRMFPSAKVCIRAKFNMLKGGLVDSFCCFVIAVAWWVQFEITDFRLEMAIFNRIVLTPFSP